MNETNEQPKKSSSAGFRKGRGQKKKSGNEGGIMKEAADNAAALPETGR